MSITVTFQNPNPGISDYGSLIQTVADFLARSDLANSIPTFIQLAESRIKRKLRIREMEQTVTLTTTAGQNTIPLPAGYMQMRRFINTSAPEANINYRAPAQFYAMHDPVIQGRPVAFTIEGENLVLGPTPSDAYTLIMSFYGAFNGLSQSNTSNTLLLKYPDVYLYGALLSAEAYLVRDERLPVWKSEFEQACAEVQASDLEDRHSGGALTISSDVAL